MNNTDNKNNVTLQQRKQLAELFGISLNDVEINYETIYGEDVILQLAKNEWLAFNTKKHTYRYFETESVDFYDPYTDLSNDMDFDLHIVTDIEMHKKITKALQILNFI